MVEDKGLPAESADEIGKYVGLHGAPHEMLQRLNSMDALAQHTAARAALDELQTMFELLDAMAGLSKVRFVMHDRHHVVPDSSVDQTVHQLG